MDEIAPSKCMAGDGLLIVEDRPTTSLLRTCSLTPDHVAALRGRFGVDWPVSPNSTARFETPAGSAQIVWLAPQEWAIVGLGAATATSFIDNLCPGAVVHVADMSDAWIRWDLGGTNVLKLISKGCSLDLHHTTFVEGKAARTLLGQVHVLLVRRRDGWMIHAEAALRRHIWLWLEAAGREFNLCEHRACRADH